MEFDRESYKTFLLGSIHPSQLAGGGTHVMCRCFYCPDGKSPDSKHFYISIPKDDKTPSLYYCHKCHASGVVSYKTLIEWGIYDSSIAEHLVYHNKNCSKYIGNHKYYDNMIYHIINQYNEIDHLSEIKMNYLRERLGYYFTYEELEKYKIVLNLNTLLKRNQIQWTSRNIDIANQLDGNFLGFLSIDNAFLNMRRLCNQGLVYKSIDKRYINYKIFDKFDTSERFYTIPTTINLNQKERIKIHIAEGPFDILSIYLNLRFKKEGIYTSIAGSNYIGQAIYFIDRFKLAHNEFHYYPDNDRQGSRYKMEKLKEFLLPTGSTLYIHRNQYPGQKDFGVSWKYINESIEQIL